MPFYNYVIFFQIQSWWSYDSGRLIPVFVRSPWHKTNNLYGQYGFTHLIIMNFILIELGRSYCGSFYCSYLWTQFNKSTISKIRVAYNDLYRKILHVSRRSSASEMFVKNNIPNFESLLRKETFSFTSRLKCSSNAIISTIESWFFLRGRFY